jgi:hypothetical protein
MIFSLTKRTGWGKTVDRMFSPSSNVAEQSGQTGFLETAVSTISFAELFFRLKKKDSPNQISITPTVINNSESIFGYISVVYSTFIEFSSRFFITQKFRVNTFLLFLLSP